MFPHPQNPEYAGLSWCDHAWPDIEQAAKEGSIVVLPLGSIEQHGPMVPVGCDFYLAASYTLEGARRAREKYGLKALVLPPIPYGMATHHRDFPGTVSLELDAYMQVIQLVIRDVIRAGFMRVACVSGHGGNIMPAQMALRDLGDKLYEEGVHDVRLYMADQSNCFRDVHALYAKMPQGQFNFHADAVETSYYMFQRPDLVRREGLVKPELRRQGKPLHAAWRTTEITESGASGDPTRANAAYGEEIFRYVGDAIADFLKLVAEDE